MKKLIFASLLLFGTLLIISSCQKESMDITPEAELTQALNIQSDLTDVDADAMVIAVPGGPVVPQLLAPDLIISNYTTNIASTTTSCGGTLPNGSCVGGTRFFTATVTIQNIGNRNLPAGNITVRWADLTTGSTQDQTVPHPGIPVGGTFAVSRPYYLGPCDCVPPPTFFTHSFQAMVDPTNVIVELNNGNNRSAVYVICDGC